MRIKVLGCNGGISGNRRTTCYQAGSNILIDAGTGAGDLTLQQVIAINTVFLTHSHLDHCAMLPMLADAAGRFRNTPLVVHALPETIATLKEHMFNGRLWPDYTRLPAPERPYIHFKPVALGEAVALQDCRITALPAKHSIPAVAYQVDSGAASWVYSGDTTFCEDFWQALNHIANLKYVLIEATCLNSNTAGALRSGHMTAGLLAQGLSLLKQPAELFIVHMDAGREDDTLHEVLQAAGKFGPQALEQGREFVF